MIYENERHQAKITVIPVVNERQELIDILFDKPDLDKSPCENIGLPLVIMAGGKGYTTLVIYQYFTQYFFMHEKKHYAAVLEL